MRSKGLIMTTAPCLCLTVNIINMFTRRSSQGQWTCRTPTVQKSHIHLFASLPVFTTRPWVQEGRASLVAQLVKNLPAMQENWVWSLGREDHLEEGMATHFSILAWRRPMDRAWRATVHGVKSQTRLSNSAQHTAQPRGPGQQNDSFPLLPSP